MGSDVNTHAVNVESVIAASECGLPGIGAQSDGDLSSLECWRQSRSESLILDFEIERARLQMHLSHDKWFYVWRATEALRVP